VQERRKLDLHSHEQYNLPMSGLAALYSAGGLGVGPSSSGGRTSSNRGVVLNANPHGSSPFSPNARSNPAPNRGSTGNPADMWANLTETSSTTGDGGALDTASVMGSATATQALGGFSAPTAGLQSSALGRGGGRGGRGGPNPAGAYLSERALQEQDMREEEHRQRLRMILHEMKLHAQEVERQMFDLEFQLKEKTLEAERLRKQLKITPEDALAEAEANERFDQQLESRIVALGKKVAEQEREISQLGEEKLSLLRKVDRHLNGGTMATAADGFLFTMYNRSKAATQFAKVVDLLPKANVERLNEALFFDYAKNVVHSALVQSQKRRAAVELESAIMTALHHAGLRANLARIIYAVDEEDLEKL
jgi:hypothetical protein